MKLSHLFSVVLGTFKEIVLSKTFLYHISLLSKKHQLLNNLSKICNKQTHMGKFEHGFVYLSLKANIKKIVMLISLPI